MHCAYNKAQQQRPFTELYNSELQVYKKDWGVFRRSGIESNTKWDIKVSRPTTLEVKIVELARVLIDPYYQKEISASWQYWGSGSRRRG